MYKMILFLLAVALMFIGATVSTPQAEDVPMTCTAPTTNEDGTSFVDPANPTPNELAGYYNCVATVSGGYDRLVICDDDMTNVPCCKDIGNTLSYTVPLPSNGRTYYITRFSYDALGNRSEGYSNEVSKSTQDAIPPSSGGGCASL